jgi:predicted dienelactone hydrolase
MRAAALTLLVTIAATMAAAFAPPPTAAVAAACQPPFDVGFKVVRAGSTNVGVWYPATGDEANLEYAKNVKGRARKDGALDSCARFPLVAFSHGFSGCGIQIVYLTEEVARRGYIVAAPDHKDALCSVTGKGSLRAIKTDQSFFAPDKWNDKTHADRRDNLARVIDWMMESSQSEFRGSIEPGKIGLIGHSLGGYDVLGLAGGWDSWIDRRVGAVVALSPYATPCIVKNRMTAIRVPVMYQGAQWDVGITPYLKGDRGAFALSNAPKYYVELKGGGHFEWTNMPCGSSSVARCLDSKANPRLIDEYAIAFLDRYLKNDAAALSRLDGKGLAAYRQEPGTKN